MAACQHGVVTRDQLLHELALSPNSIKRLVDQHRLRVLRQGVYAVGGAPIELPGALFAASAGRRLSSVSHRSSAWLWRLPGRASVVEVASPRWRRARGSDVAGFELCVHESFHLSERDVVEIDGIPRTRVARTLIDLGTSVALGHIELEVLVLAMQDAVRRGLTDLEQLERTYERLAPEFRIGARAARRALDQFQPALSQTESPPEILVGRALLAAGYEIVPQYELSLSPTWTVRLDFYLSEFHRAVEVNPFSTHGGVRQHQYDIARALRIRTLHGIDISAVGDEEIARGCPELLALLATLRREAA